MEKLFLQQEQESTPSVWEKTISKLKHVGQLLVAVTVLSALYESMQGDKISVKADVGVESKIESLPDPIQLMLKKATEDLGAHVTPQIILPEGDIVIELAQQHSITHVDAHVHQEFTDENTTVQCQKKVYKFAENILDTFKNGDIEPIFLSEGMCDTSVSISKELDEAAEYFYEDLIKERNFEDTLKKRLGTFLEDSPLEIAETRRYEMLTRLLKKNKTEGSLDVTQKEELDLILQSWLNKIDTNILYHAGGMYHVGRIHDVNIQKTEDAEILIAGLKKIKAGNVSPEDMIISMEDRENAVVKNIQDLSFESNKENPKRKVFILPFGAEHDFYNNLKDKGMSLIRVNVSGYEDIVDK